jgi:hypothetical protein
VGDTCAHHLAKSLSKEGATWMGREGGSDAALWPCSLLETKVQPRFSHVSPPLVEDTGDRSSELRKAGGGCDGGCELSV